MKYNYKRLCPKCNKQMKFKEIGSNQCAVCECGYIEEDSEQKKK